LFLFDLKMMDKAEHEHYTGVPNDVILSNLEKLSEEGIPIEIRIPLIAGVNDKPSNIRRTAAFLSELPKKPRICLLPYHEGGRTKFNRLHTEKSECLFAPPADKQVARIEEALSGQGFAVKVGG